MRIICVDFQRDFAAEGGQHYQPRPCIPFIQDVLVPFVRERGYQIAEIISDYRISAPQSEGGVCVPGEWGYQSEIPSDIKMEPVWVKAETSPSWIRAGGGDPTCEAGEPYPEPNAFTAWLRATLGPPGAKRQVVLIGLLLEVCVLCTLQELKFRGYEVKVLVEGVDTYSGNSKQKQRFLETLFPFWGQAISWEELRRQASK